MNDIIITLRNIEIQKAALLKFAEDTKLVQILDYEKYQAKIQDVMQHIDQCTELFKVCMHFLQSC